MYFGAYLVPTLQYIAFSSWSELPETPHDRLNSNCAIVTRENGQKELMVVGGVEGVHIDGSQRIDTLDMETLTWRTPG